MTTRQLPPPPQSRLPRATSTHTLRNPPSMSSIKAAAIGSNRSTSIRKQIEPPSVPPIRQAATVRKIPSSAQMRRDASIAGTKDRQEKDQPSPNRPAHVTAVCSGPRRSLLKAGASTSVPTRAPLEAQKLIPPASKVLRPQQSLPSSVGRMPPSSRNAPNAAQPPGSQRDLPPKIRRRLHNGFNSRFGFAAGTDSSPADHPNRTPIKSGNSTAALAPSPWKMPRVSVDQILDTELSYIEDDSVEIPAPRRTGPSTSATEKPKALLATLGPPAETSSSRIRRMAGVARQAGERITAEARAAREQAKLSRVEASQANLPLPDTVPEASSLLSAPSTEPKVESPIADKMPTDDDAVRAEMRQRHDIELECLREQLRAVKRESVLSKYKIAEQQLQILLEDVRSQRRLVKELVSDIS